MEFRLSKKSHEVIKEIIMDVRDAGMIDRDELLT